MTEEKTHREFDKGSMTTTLWNFDGIRMGHAVSRYKELTMQEAGNANDVVRLHFGLKGDYLFEHKQLGKTYDLIGGHHNIMYSNGFDMVVRNKTLILETFGVQFPREHFVKFTQDANDALKRFAECVVSGKSAILSEKWGTVDPVIEQVINQIIYCKYTGELKKLFLLSKSIELLVLSAEACSAAENSKGVYLKSKTDKQKIIAVRDLINEKVTDPPNLSEIARTVGLNEYKLKRGFKETFNNTVFGYLTDQRLHLAHRYLRDTGKTAAEISYDLGYATPQH